MLQFLNFPKSITLIYGPPASGKSTLCLQIAANNPGKIIYIDTENAFNIERIQQINPLTNVENIIVMKAKRYSEQTKAVAKLKDTKNISLVIIDSFTVHYRKKTKEEKKLFINKSFKRMLEELKELKIPIILTSPIYTDFKRQDHPIAQELLKKYATYTLRLENKGKRKAIIEETKVEIPFIITDQGIEV
ncbi:MAG: bifunctional adenosylcobinamide kinase/adenosylcobinamide-phosphate guanylyltransferase [bacterium]|nr:bifunctional adenosylcobinamide kinase/adenosylcobinamide-phosphate guanylyltransferase [bacterium]